MTVFFADLCGSTARVHGADPEEARDVLDGVIRMMSAAVESYGGTISRFLGDGLLALFGAPVAQEDHAMRACLAALAMQQRSRESGSIGGPAEPFQLRVGIASGEALVGVASEYGWPYYRADGQVVHLAARLEQLARPGSVLVSGSVFRLLGGQLEATALGSQEVRGFDAPVALYELAPSGHGFATAPLAARRQWAPLVGRNGVLNGLDVIVRQVRKGHMHVVGVRGEAGIGKSRLIAEFSASPCVEGFAVCTVQARAYLSRNAYSLVAELARELLQLPTTLSRPGQREWLLSSFEQPREALARHLPVLCDLLDLEREGEERLALDAEQRRRRCGEAVHALIVQRLKKGPLLVVVEDVFLADAESRNLLEVLVPRLERMPVLVCASYRPEFNHRWAEAPWFIEQWIGPLQSHEMVRLARSLLGPHESLEAVVQQLVARADGNPFFLEQLAITLIDDGSLVGPACAYRRVRNNAELRVPASIAAVIGARVDRLPVATKASLEVAAILGEPVSVELVAAVLGVPGLQAQEHLKLGVAAGLMTAPSDKGAGGAPGYTFRHSLVQEALAGSLTRPRRAALHRQAFVVLSAGTASSACAEPSVIAQHAYSGEVWAEAAEWSVKAMARAVARSASREALRLFDVGMVAAKRALDPEQTLKLEMSLLLEAIGARMPLGQIDEIVADVERAGEIAKRLGDERRMAAVSLQLAVFLWMRGKYSQGLVYAAQAGEAGRRTERRNLEMAAAQARMMMNHGLGRYRDAVATGLFVCNEFATELRGRRMLAGWATVPLINTLSFLASSQWRLGLLEQAQATCDDAYGELAKFEHAYSRGLIDFVQAQMWIEQGRLGEATQLMRDSTRMCELNDVPTLYPCAVAMLGGALARAGHVREALELLTKALAQRAHLAGGTYGELFLRHNLGIALTRTGQHDKAIEMAHSAVDFAAAGEQHGHQAEALFELAEALAAAGEVRAAGVRWQESRDQALRCEMPYFVAQASERLGRHRSGVVDARESGRRRGRISVAGEGEETP